MICSFILGLFPLNIDEQNSKIYKYTNYHYLKKILSIELTEEELKKITVSNFMTKDRIFKEKSYYIRISSIDSGVTLKILKILFFTKLTNGNLKINDLSFRINNIYHSGNWAKQLNIDELISKELKNEIKLRIVTPIFFKIGNEYINSLEPIYIFKNLIKKIKESSLNEHFILKNIKNFNIDRVEIVESNLESREIRKLKTIGSIGNITLIIRSSIEEEILFFNILLYFAFFSGIGYMTERGYGCIELLQD